MFGYNSIIAILIIVGILLLLMEIFIIPGFGISGILGMVFLFTGIFLVTDSFFEGVLFSGGALIVIGILVYLSFRTERTRKIWRRLSLTTRQTLDDGYVGPKEKSEDYLGRIGIAVTLLRPAGTADFDGELLDVVTEGGLIEPNKRVRIVAVEGTRVVVREEKEENLLKDNLAKENLQ